MVKQVELFKNVNGEWSWRLVAKNNEILSHSESYTRKWSALRTAKKIAQGLNVPLMIKY